MMVQPCESVEVFILECRCNQNNSRCLQPSSIRQELPKMVKVGLSQLVFYDNMGIITLPVNAQKIRKKGTYRLFPFNHLKFSPQNLIQESQILN